MSDLNKIQDKFKCCGGYYSGSGFWLHKSNCHAFLEEKKEEDKVNHPRHYTFGKVEVIDVLEEWFSTKPLLWQVGKYIARAGKKGDELEDLKKARWYLDKQIMKMEAERAANKK
jgi:hypothetical protein